MGLFSTTPDAPGIEIDNAPAKAQQSLMLDEAIATWSARNRLREAMTARISTMILEGKDPSQLMNLLDKLCSPDDFTKQVLSKLLS